MKPLLVLALGLSIGCKDDISTSAPENISIQDYHGFSSEASWTFRDSTVDFSVREEEILDTPPDEGELLRVRYTGNGELDFRRGARWADGTRAGVLSFFLDSDFSLTGWDLGPYRGEGDLPLGNEQPLDGQAVEASGWFCKTVRRTEVETYYGYFDDIVQFDCTGDAGPSGQWTFARDMGLVAYDSVDYSLSLVAPW
jgi:hypothetical protein